MAYRFERAERFHAPLEAWREAATEVLMDMLDVHPAMTISEMEARASDQTWNTGLWPHPIFPHLLGQARSILRDEGLTEPMTGQTKGGMVVTTWSRTDLPRRKRAIETTAARKRLLTGRHTGWGHRGGGGRGLIGRAGENSTHAAMTHTDVPLAQVSGSTRMVLGHPLTGEVDNSAVYVDQTNPAAPEVITVLVEVKNQRSWFYPGDKLVQGFLAKAADLQAHRPDQLILPVFLARRRNATLWAEGVDNGFLSAYVVNQQVLSDHELDQHRLEEVQDGLGYTDLLLGDEPTKRHIGIFKTAVPRRARELAELWRVNHVNYLAARSAAAATKQDLWDEWGLDEEE